MRVLPIVSLLLLATLGWAAPPSFTLTKNGAPAATIVIAKDACRGVRFAAQELQEHVQKISGALLPVATDDQPVTGPRVLIGDSAAMRKLQLRGSQFRPQEYLIRFLPGALVLLGRDKPEPVPTNVTVTGSPQRVAGRFGGGLQFTGRDSLTIEDCAFEDTAGSLECWVNFNQPTQAGEETLLRLDGSIGGWSYHILRRLSDDSVMYVIYDGTNGYSVTSKPLAPGWHHLLATHDAASQQIELFVDGASVGTAKFTHTGCRGAALGLGGIANSASSTVGNPYTGMLDEVRLSNTVVKPDAAQAPVRTADTKHLLHLDENQGAPVDVVGRSRLAPPDGFDDQGSLYATHEFLERFCGVRWYGPGDLGLVCPQRATLTVQGADVRRKPALAYRDPYPGNGYGLQAELWNHPSAAECRVFWSRIKAGGQPYSSNHSFYGYYDRFYEKNPQHPELFEGAHPDWFAQGYAGRPNQMCFTNPGFAAQVARDADDYFDGKGLKPGAAGRGDYFGYVPMDTNGWCKCPVCAPLFDQSEKDNPQFSNGKTSDYMFHSANLVAAQLRRTHPDKYLATLAYWEYAYTPKHTVLEPNISVQMCLHVRNWWDKSMEANDLKFYRDWVSHEGKRRPLYLWVYYCFPEEVATNGKFHCFPGFFAHTLDRQIKMFAQDGIRGIFFNGLGEQVDTYLTFKLMDDPRQNVDKLLDEFFTGYYGAAAGPMKQLYLRIERIYMDPKSYPEAVQRGDHHTHQTEEIAWGYLGTEARMAELAGLMAQAKAAARTELERQRVGLFETAIWDYMVEGRAQWVRKTASSPEREALKAQAPPTLTVPAVANAGGQTAQLDWGKALRLDQWQTLQGYPTTRQPVALLAHDGTHLYVRLQESVDAAALVSSPEVFNGDDWEIYFAGGRGFPAGSRNPSWQLAINPQGKCLAYTHPSLSEQGPWEAGATVTSTTTGGMWTVTVAVPLAKLPTAKLYANFFRSISGGDYLAFRPNFGDRFNAPERFAELQLQ